MDPKATDTAANNRMSSPLHFDSDNDSLSEIECNTCNRSFLDAKAFAQHMNSKKHQNQLMKKKLGSKQKSLEDISSDEENEFNSKYSQLHCEVCSMDFTGYKSYAAHLQGSIHHKNQKKQALKKEFENHPDVNCEENSDDDLLPKPIAKCSLCMKEFTSLDSFKCHQASVGHKKKLKKEKVLESLKKENNDGDSGNDFYKKCEVCDKPFSGPLPYNIHMNSGAHHKALKKIEARRLLEGQYIQDSTDDSKLICKECNKTFTDPFAFQTHLDNNSHKKYEAKAKIMNIVNAYPEIVAGKTLQSAASNLDEEENYRIGDYILLCKLCHMSFTGPESAVDHVKSKKHLKIKEDREIMKQLQKRQEKANDEADVNKLHKNSVKSNGNNSAAQSENEQKMKNTSNNGVEADDFELI